MLSTISLVTWGILFTIPYATAAPEPSPIVELGQRSGYHGDFNCKHLVFTVDATATNQVIASPAASTLSTQEGVNAFYASLKGLVAASIKQTRGGTYRLAAEYCHALTRPELFSAPLQILVHGSAGYTKDYWNRGSWGNAPLEYSWTHAMNRAGYSTLAVDKLGNGESSHPDPVNDVQLPLQMETIHSLITLIKSGKAGIPMPPEGGLIFVGHSTGSIMAADLAQTHPSDVDAVVLTGYPTGGNNKGGLPSYHFLPAALSRPDQYPKGLNYGYMRMNSEFNRTAGFYYKGHYDPRIAHLDYETHGAQPIGEGINLGLATQPAFKGKALVVTGTKDPAICGFTPVEKCKFNSTILTDVGERFSGNSGFDWYSPVSGHVLNWHYNAPQTYQVVIQRLGRLLGKAAPSGGV